VTTDLQIGVSGRVLDRHVGGNTTYARRLYEHLAGEGVNGYVLRPPGSRTVSARIRSLEYLVYEGWWAQMRAARMRLSAVHFPADTGPLARATNVPLVVTVHGAAALHEPAVRGRTAGRIWVERTRRAIRLADVVITVSESSAGDIRQLAYPLRPRIEVIPHGIDHDTFHPATREEIAHARVRHGLNRPFAFFMGNLEPRKNLIALVGAMERLNADGTDLELIVAGRPAWNAEATIDAISGSRHSRRIGWIDDKEVRGVMSACEMFVFPSLYEGFGLPVLEAMACGAPVVCTRGGSLPEVAGDAAVYASGPEPALLAEAIRTCLETPRQALRSSGIQRAAEYQWITSARRHREVFQSVI